MFAARCLSRLALFSVCLCLLVSIGGAQSDAEATCKETDHWLKASDLSGPSRQMVLDMLDEEEISSVKHVLLSMHVLKGREAFKKLPLGAARAFEDHVESTRNVNNMDAEGRTALMRAARRGRLENVVALLQKGAKTDLKDNAGRTALHWAQAGDHQDIVKALAVAHLEEEKKRKEKADAPHSHADDAHGWSYPSVSNGVIALIVGVASAYFYGMYMLFTRVK